MIITIQTFGITRDIADESGRFELEIADNTTAAELKNILFQKFPALQKLQSLAIAINENYATGREIINATDRIALIPPVSGG